MPARRHSLIPRGVSAALLAALALVPAAAHAQRGGGAAPTGPQPTQPVGPPRFEYAGPSSAGRISAAAAVAGAPGVYYAGAASGGVWKSVDGGATWKPTFDGQTSQAIGALAVAPSNPSIVWAGTGEGWTVRDMDMMGDGIYDKMYNAELHFLSRTEMHSDDKWYVEKYKLYLNLVWLLAEVGGSGSDVAGGAGYRPTNASLSVYEDRLRELTAARADFEKLLRDVEAFNKANAGKVAAITDKK